MKNAFLSFLLLLFISQTVYADDYNKYAEEVRKQVWNWEIPAFHKYVVPEKYDTASVIIMAWQNDLSLVSKKKLQFDPTLLLTSNDFLYYTNVNRLMIKINDKKALDEYSEFSYQQFMKQKGYNSSSTMTSILGARIIKPNGKIVDINVSDEVALLDEKANKQRKLAIPNLQIGDILDYFIWDEKKTDNFLSEPIDFSLAYTCPVLYKGIHCEIGNGVTAEYRSINGAPDFNYSVDSENSNKILDLKQTDLPIITNSIWTLPYRQYPIVRLALSHYSNNKQPKPKNARKPDAVYKNINYEEIIKDIEWSACIESNGWSADSKGSAFHIKEITELTNQYKLNHPEATSDSIAAFIYYAYRHYMFNYIYDKDEITVNHNRNYKTLKNRYCAILLERLLYYMGEKNYGLGFVSNQNGPRLEEIISRYDTEFLVSTINKPERTFSVPGVFTNAWYLPSEYEGEKAAVIQVEKYQGANKGIKGTSQENIDLPLSTDQQNIMKHDLSVSIDPNSTDIVIDKTVTSLGNLKEPFQQLLMLFEDYEAEERQMLGIKQTFFEEMEADKNKRKLIPDYQAAFAKARKDQKDYFLYETELSHDRPSKEMLSYEILNSGMFHQNPAFIFRSKYKMDGLVKNAGNNFIFDAGLLIGNQLILNSDETNRKIDAYMPFARHFEWNIEIQIPEGYNVEGLENLNKNTTTAYGQFISSAVVIKNTVKISVIKNFSSAFVPVEKWNELLPILDTANAFVGQKLLFVKR